MNSEARTRRAVRRSLLGWGRDNLRVYPWREMRDPYRVLLAEVLLHRTRADQVVPVYLRAVEDYPTVSALAGADLPALKAILRPLGLFWRVPLLREMAREIVARFGGQVPASAAELRTLPGVGPYIAGATACFAFDAPEPILDTNTVRLLGRLFGLEVQDSSRRNKKFRTMMEGLQDGRSPRLFNLTLLDLAALVCTPTRPSCERCPLVKYCVYGSHHANPK